MKEVYAKVTLYAFKNLLKIADQIDELVEKKAFSSISDTSPALKQYEKITALTYQKRVVLSLAVNIGRALGKLSASEYEYLDYKYFRGARNSKTYSFDPSSRNYFRIQNRVLKKYAFIMDRGGFTDERFEKELLAIDFFREMLKRVTEKENARKKCAAAILSKTVAIANPKIA